MSWSGLDGFRGCSRTTPHGCGFRTATRINGLRRVTPGTIPRWAAGRLRMVTSRLQATDRRLAEGRQHAGRSRGSRGMSAAEEVCRAGCRAAVVPARFHGSAPELAWGSSRPVTGVRRCPAGSTHREPMSQPPAQRSQEDGRHVRASIVPTAGGDCARCHGRGMTDATPTTRWSTPDHRVPAASVRGRRSTSRPCRDRGKPRVAASSGVPMRAPCARSSDCRSLSRNGL
jgi:hypothetical protein